MPIALRILKLPNGLWAPDHDVLRDRFVFGDDRELTSEEVRRSLWEAVERLHPGEYTLDVSLEELRERCFAKIDACSTVRIAQGFTHRGVIFSLSIAAQTRYTAMLATASLLLGYPIAINSLDDHRVIELRNLGELQAFCKGALEVVRTIVDSGTVEKDKVRAMTDPVKLAAYEDPR